jgi:hypothetical protein
MQNFGWKELGKENIWRTNGRLDDNFKLDHKETGWKFVNNVHLVHNKHKWRALINMEMDLQV